MINLCTDPWSFEANEVSAPHQNGKSRYRGSKLRSWFLNLRRTVASWWHKLNSCWKVNECLLFSSDIGGVTLWWQYAMITSISRFRYWTKRLQPSQSQFGVAIWETSLSSSRATWRGQKTSKSDDYQKSGASRPSGSSRSDRCCAQIFHAIHHQRGISVLKLGNS